jgi:hypothetical protein
MLSSQDCFDFVQEHFDKTEELCGYHGALHFKIQETDEFNDALTESAELFLQKWLAEKYGASYEYFNFWQTNQSETLNNTMRYEFSYKGFLLENVTFILTFDNNGNLRSYNVACVNGLKDIDEEIAIINTKEYETGIDESSIISSTKKVKYQDAVLSFLETIKYYNDESQEAKAILDLISGEIIYDSKDDNFKNAFTVKPTTSKANNNPCQNNDSGFIGVALPPYSYPLSNDCIQGPPSNYTNFQATHDYIVGELIGETSGTDLKIICENQKRRIAHIPNWIRCDLLDQDYEHDTNHFLFCSEPDTGDADEGKFEYTMTYYHLARFYRYLNTNLIGNSEYTGYAAMPQEQILFDPYDPDLGEVYEVSYNSNLNVSTISYGAAINDSSSRHLAEDSHYIVAGGFQAYWENIMLDNPSTSSNSEGLFYGAMDYLIWRYNSNELGDNSTNLYNWGSVPGEFSRSLTISLSYDDVIDNPDFNSPQKKGQIFSSTLHQIAIDEILSIEIADFLLFKTLPTMMAGNDQPAGAQMLYDAAELEHTDDNSMDVDISAEQLCKIAKILKNRYSALNAPITNDFYVRDSYEGQPRNWDNPIPQGEDIGNEPNNITFNFSKSYDIWNKLSPGSTDPDDKEHQSPVYNNGALNYLYVDIRNRECAELDPNATVHAYIREQHSASIWPDGWITGFYTGVVPLDPNNPPDDNPLVGYEITSNPDDILESIGVPVTEYILNFTDSEGRDVYRYEIPWVPLNPLSLPDYNEWGAQTWACLLVRLVSDLDPMPANEDGVNAWNNNWRSNNYAIRNTSLIHVAGDPLAPPGEPGEPNVFGWNVESVEDADPNDPNDDGTNTNDIIFSILPDVMIGPGNDVFNFLDIDIMMTDEFYLAWKKGGFQGSGFTWLDKTIIKITDKNFSFKNLKLKRKMPHRIFFSVRQLRSFDNIAFDMTMIDETGCAKGGQEFLVKGDSPLALKKENLTMASRQSFSDDYEIYPNPANSQITIEGKSLDEISNLRILNMLGKEINARTINANNNEINIDMSEYDSGVYFVILNTKDKVDKVLKFIKL